jgi:hypothetical protein
MDYNLIFNTALYIALIISLALFAISIFKKRLSRKFLIRFFIFLIFVSVTKIFTSLMVTILGIENTGNYLIITFLLLTVTFAFLRNSLFLIKNEDENIW